MKYYPLLCNDEDVRGIFDGRKTQFRRPVKPQPDCSGWKPGTVAEPHKCPQLGPAHHGWSENEWGLYCSPYHASDVPLFAFKSPFGGPGDRLWVRECYAFNGIFDNYRPNIVSHNVGVECRAGRGFQFDAINRGKWRPNILMPRWASRITLEVLDVRVERVQDITEKDCWAEAVNTVGYTTLTHSQLRNGFAVGWDSIYKAKGLGWDENPPVWAGTFQRVD